jgi:LCCL domain
MLHRRILGALILAIVVACGLKAAPQNAPLPGDAQQILTQTLVQLQSLAERYMATGQISESLAIQEQIRRLQATMPAATSIPLQTPFGGSLRMAGYRDRVGQTFRVRVTGALRGGTVWGTDTYTDDSDLAVAVVHTGLLAAGQDGEVLITFVAGQNQYQGSTRNGVTTRQYDSWPVSYRLDRVGAASASLPMLPPPSTPQSMFILTAAPFPTIVNGAIQIGPNGFPFDDQNLWQLLGGQPSGNRANAGPNLMGLRGRVGESFEYDVTGATQGAIWGDGIYTDDSELGVTAVHAGLLRPGERGRVRVTVLPAQQRYEAASRNGVNSQSYRGWEGSYRVERADPR